MAKIGDEREEIPLVGGTYEHGMAGIPDQEQPTTRMHPLVECRTVDEFPLVRRPDVSKNFGDSNITVISVLGTLQGKRSYMSYLGSHPMNSSLILSALPSSFQDSVEPMFG